MEFIHHPKILLLVIFLSIPVYIALARAFWGEKFESFSDALKSLFRPDFDSLRSDWHWRDRAENDSIFWFLLICIGWAAAITELIVRHFL